MAKGLLAALVGLVAALTFAVVVGPHLLRNDDSLGGAARAQCGGKQANPVCTRLVTEKLRNHSLHPRR